MLKNIVAFIFGLFASKSEVVAVAEPIVEEVAVALQTPLNGLLTKAGIAPESVDSLTNDVIALVNEILASGKTAPAAATAAK